MFPCAICNGSKIASSENNVVAGIMLSVWTCLSRNMRCTPTLVLLGFVVSVVNLPPALWAFNPCPTQESSNSFSVLEVTLLQDPSSPTDTSSSFNQHQKPCRNNLKWAVINCDGLYDKIPQLETYWFSQAWHHACHRVAPERQHFDYRNNTTRICHIS